MKPYRVLIADDEPPARKKLRALFASVADFTLARECADGDEALRTLAEERFDLVLLDVQMPGKSGLDVARALASEDPPLVVFVTAFDAHAVRAFELHALDYLLKPFDRERFQAMLARARREIARASSAHARRLEALLADLAAKSAPIALRSGGRTLLVEPRAIEWIEAADNYLRLHGPGLEHLVRGTLSALEERLAGHGFLRIHRSLLVNERAVRELRPDPNGELQVVLAGGARLVVGRTYRPAVEACWRGRSLEERRSS